MKTLDGLIRTMSLTMLDRGDPHVPVFDSHAVPTFRRKPSNARDHSPEFDSHSPRLHRKKECSCHSFTLAQNWPASNDLTPLWNSTPAWPNDWPEGELRKEECRRLVWSSVILAAGHSSYNSASSDIPPLNLYIMDPAHVSFMVSRSMSSCKDQVFALVSRGSLLLVLIPVCLVLSRRSAHVICRCSRPPGKFYMGLVHA